MQIGVQEAGIIPDKYNRDKEETAEDGKSVNILMCNLARQQRQDVAGVSVNAGN